MIGEIESLRAKIKRCPPLDRQYEDTMQAEVNIVQSRPEQDILPGVSELVSGRRREATGVKPPSDRGIREFAVADAIGPGGSAGIRIVE